MWEYIHLNVDEFAVEQLSVVEYSEFKEPCKVNLILSLLFPIEEIHRKVRIKAIGINLCSSDAQ